MMYEGKNIHYSSSDSKLLCSFSSKLCNQRRLNGYGFCVRHILEDPTAPFKRCAYVAKSSNQMCTQAIPKHEERRYCNNHMQVLGMLPKKERKKKDKPAVVSENKLHLANSGSVKAKFSLSKDNSLSLTKPALSTCDPDDPYAFSDTGPADNKLSGLSSGVPAASDSVLGKSLQTGQGFVRSASDINSIARCGPSGGSTIAKYYPELAEKLEKMRAKPEPKAAVKSRSRSSRTMNKLQTKIAQNRINEKLKKSQEMSQTDSNSSPLQVSSPEQGMEYEHSPSPGPVFSPSPHAFSPQTSNFLSNHTFPGYKQGHGTQDVSLLPQTDTSFLGTLAGQEALGLSDKHLVTHTPPRLPPPYPGSSTLSTPSSLASSDLPASAFSPQSHPSCVSESFGTAHSPQRASITPSGPSGSSSLSSLPFSSPHSRHISLQTPTPPVFLSPCSSSSFPSSVTSQYSFPTLLRSSQDSHHSTMKPHNNQTLPAAPPNIDIFSLLYLNPKQLNINPTTGLPQPNMLLSPNTLASHLCLPPPPPYVPPTVVPPAKVGTATKHLPAHQKSATTAPAVAPKNQVLHTKLHKLTGILSEKAAKRKLKSDLAVQFYSFYVKRKVNDHCMLGPYLCSSDDDSGEEDVDMLPWQRDVFSASSDEEADDDDELGNDVPMGMRPTKVSLLKTRLRRQWCQARKAYKTNKLLRSNSNQATLALIRTARDSMGCAVRALWQITHMKKSRRKLQKRKRKRKTCCHRNEKEGQCQNQCLPYANHCLKHITYNINQQLFDFCTAKFANNVQCCLPSFDLRHELPLCLEHAAKTDNYQKQLEMENKKKPRKKSKPPALTRPPRKGKKKKKKGRHARAQKSASHTQSTGLDSAPSDVDVTSVDTPRQEDSSMPISSSPTFIQKKELPDLAPQTTQPSVLTNGFSTSISSASKNLEPGLELVDTLSPDFDKPFELPLEQASRLLDESDFQEVVNKMPFYALDLFGKNGEPDPEPEGEQMSIDLTSASKARDALEKLLTGTMSEEESMQIAMLLAQNLHTDAELAQNTISEIIPNPAGQGDSRILAVSGGMGMDISLTPHLVMPSGLDSVHVNDPAILALQAPGLSESAGSRVAHAAIQAPHRPQLASTIASGIPGSYSHHDSQKLSNSLHHLHQQTTTAPSLDGVPSVFTADLNAIYGHAETVPRSHLSVEQQTPGLNLGHVAGLDAFSASATKTVICHLPSVTQSLTSIAGASTQNLYSGSAHVGYSAEMVNASPIAPQTFEHSRSVVNLETSVTAEGCGVSSLSIINSQPRAESGLPYQNLSSSSSSDLSETLSLSLPPHSKRAKLTISPKPPQPVIPHQLQQIHPHHHPQPTQHMLQPAHNRTLTLPDATKNLRPPSDLLPLSPKPHMVSAAGKSSATIGPPLPTRRLALPGVETLQQHRESLKTSFTISSLHSPDNSKLKLQPANVSSTQDFTQTRITIPDSSQQDITTIISTTSASSSFSSVHSSPNTVRYSLMAENVLAPTSSLTTTICHNLLTGPSGPTTESILVTVRQPSPLESVPTTVKHTLPDTLSTPITLPSPPSLHIPPPPSSLRTSHEGKDSNQPARLSQSHLHPEHQHPQWVPANPPTITLQNGQLQFVSAASRTNKLIPAGQGSVKNKQNNAAAEAARISALASAAGVPVVCSQVSLPGFVQGVSATTFKSSGSS